jgi:hypothetical protein
MHDASIIKKSVQFCVCITLMRRLPFDGEDDGERMSENM